MRRTIAILLLQLCLLQLAASTSSPKQTPIWPDSFSATLLKLVGSAEAPSASNWAKLYYSWPNRFARFDFFNSYPELVNSQPDCSIIMGGFQDTETQKVKQQIWAIFPADEGCSLAHDGLGTLSPKWVSGGKFNQSTKFRGIDAHEYLLDIPGEPGPMQYWVQADNGAPLRTTNQANDPGMTDYFDVLLVEQEKTLFELPPICKKRVNKGCPQWEEAESELQLFLQM